MVDKSGRGSETIFDAVSRQLAKHGYIARGGQMIDASMLQAPKQSLIKEEKAILVEENAMRRDRSPSNRRKKDLDARWTKKRRKAYFGDKLSVSVDKRRKLIRKIKISTVSEHDTLHCEDVLGLANTCRDAYFAKGYVNYKREERLTELSPPSKQHQRMAAASIHATTV